MVRYMKYGRMTVEVVNILHNDDQILDVFTQRVSAGCQSSVLSVLSRHDQC